MATETFMAFVQRDNGNKEPGPNGIHIVVFEDDAAIGIYLAKGDDDVSMQDETTLSIFVRIEEAEQIVEGIQAAISRARMKKGNKEFDTPYRMIVR